ncbi:L-glutamate gamma-semialdehyde dehydrogenase [Pseudonocardia sp. C8]|uniref:L-glutamate gamma-semialdehyde dehydrogenase n=1 Tax=Pseudonocardia sp. C8 TaxID=2762759 RepID=UPI001642C26D|nr:L-glutamate gamma-semialdehyde dehydrogenase [Pseudonocardia sp. C8]MBC3193405.1 L-glutamate gamma-semialdehyde dehydrogenase [Pseudonocardia sp. C8]
MTIPVDRAAELLTEATPARSYAVGTPERIRLEAALTEVCRHGHDLPVVVGGKEIRTGRTFPLRLPHDHSTELGRAHRASSEEIESAIAAASDTAGDWGRAHLAHRVAPFQKAADMLESGPWRERLVAATMLELSKTAAQADGDVAEAVDFLRANIVNAGALEQVQPHSPAGITNHMEYRPLEGFVFAISPFNFTAMNNLAFAPALLGNSVLWKPAESATLVAHLSLRLLREAGLPDGVISLLPGRGGEVGDPVLRHRDLSAVHFTGSTATLRHIWRTIGSGIDRYRDYPRIVGEAGGKDFVIAHPSADVEALAVACVRAAYDYQGQKCAAASRIYVPRSLWPEVRDRIVALTEGLAVGDPTVPGVHLGAVINRSQFEKHEAALARARDQQVVLAGGHTDGASGWFVRPTLLQVDDPHSEFMEEELFAPVMAAYVYDDRRWPETLELVDGTTGYGLTGSVFANDEGAVAQADRVLRYSAGNYYVNDRPTGATVGQQPFGGARASGTNDKVGTVWNSIRFVSPRSVKHTHDLDRDARFPALEG